MLTQLKVNIANLLGPHLSMEAEKIVSLLETPKQLDHGHLALSVFFLAKAWKKAPPVIATEVAEYILSQKEKNILSVVPAGGFVNITFRTEYVQDILMRSAAERDSIGHRKLEKEKLHHSCRSNMAASYHLGEPP